jgi:hypothetical protein
MIQVAHFVLCWGVAFASLCAAVVLLSIFFSAVDADVELMSLGKEAALAGCASLFQGIGFFVIIWVLHGGARLILLPGLIAAFLYKLGHLQDWTSYHVGALFMFQVGLWCIGAAIVGGHFGVAIAILAAFALGLTIIASIARSF